MANLAVAAAERGERVELRRGKQPVVQLVPLPPTGTERRKPGALADQIKFGKDFDVLPVDVERALGIRD